MATEVTDNLMCVPRGCGGYPPARHGKGFTVVELIVATVVMAIALLGVQATFNHLMEVEANKSVAWSDQAQVGAVADYFEQIIEQATPVHGFSAIQADTHELVCLAIPAASRSVPAIEGTTAMYRLRWGDQVAEAGTIEQQRVLLSGDQIISPRNPDIAVDDPAFWQQYASSLVASGVSSIGLRFRAIGAPDDVPWTDKWAGNPGSIEVRISVRIGTVSAQRRVFPSITGAQG
jgi:prepilin-type N-terminal cleavage/methylation domain-containing protein